MKFYIASGFENKELVQHVRDRLVEAGHSHTYDWTKNSRAVTEEDLREIGHAELDAVKESDVVVVLLPGGKGTHTELGIALGTNKEIHLFSREPINLPTATTFYYVDGISHYVGEIDMFIDDLIKQYS
ncbi:nucleoside 2-deoxyribosyltransferase [Ornithinibacillus californiensis]|uniref:nucleoside 2-deoxyribosyltransferase n=1 Tax=Ornithinibacillus californiensis TaxID=161536 RepID=UPI00064DCE89|nr:nucleoside 2-deoxyribosyltransferase [Ornithinibacillus californiensis]